MARPAAYVVDIAPFSNSVANMQLVLGSTLGASDRDEVVPAYAGTARLLRANVAQPVETVGVTALPTPVLVSVAPLALE